MTTHANIEEKRLFPRFYDNHADAIRGKISPELVRQDHADWEVKKTAFDNLLSDHAKVPLSRLLALVPHPRFPLQGPWGDEFAVTLRKAVTEYAVALRAHQQREEDAFLRPWLEMDGLSFAWFAGGVFTSMITGLFG